MQPTEMKGFENFSSLSFHFKLTRSDEGLKTETFKVDKYFYK